MFMDDLKFAQSYFCLGERFQKAFEYLRNTNFDNVEPGTYELDGKNLFVMVQAYETRDLELGKMESHKKYADIQYIISGEELMGYWPVEQLKVKEDLTPQKDILFYDYEKQNISFLKLQKGMFAIFLPQDGHMPNITCTKATQNRKCVVKILLDENV